MLFKTVKRWYDRTIDINNYKMIDNAVLNGFLYKYKYNDILYSLFLFNVRCLMQLLSYT